ncbi:NadS family protein [Testudinibacter sp. TR-2022]|uniref:NadS family protein n=1 Tax=Testudinibacter sp. TR-2022 TaxID=2585029 RepID=UPI001118919F|nr:NadS family protein [Testudinibacter sp. TR-2022]TNH07791.1 helix-turn-helix domain-containing protein [Pasteurellaceae bacterium Phil11]TNH24831.1 helix-turn-helix domain-containing protein [Testudinibacter sp. TR-2022]TNH27437.1 helix-turn-helix domain-containing protein [Testudinibacter sp. TR-2022]
MKAHFFERLRTSVEQMIAIETGELNVAEEYIHTVKIPDVKNLRIAQRLKQQEFAQMLGVSLSLVQSWELNRRIPNGPALKLLIMLERQPQLFETLKAL